MKEPDENKTSNDLKHPNIDLSDHSMSMRKALTFCQNHRILEELDRIFVDLFDDMIIEDVIKDARDSASSIRSKITSEYLASNIEVIDATSTSRMEFRKKFLHHNRPCLIRGLQSSFASITDEWRREIASDDGSNNEISYEINVDWFYQHVGEDTKVPIRICQWENNHKDNTSALDQDGRAAECKTKEITMKQWIQLMGENKNQNASGSSDREKLRIPLEKMYLKDWHLVLHFKHTKGTCMQPLYHNPSHFDGDLLNSFLTNFTPNSDFKFVYWGPRGSFTPIHSDVLHTYSWSYNVVGIKEWTLYPPSFSGVDKDVLERSDMITVRQNAGEMMFVPSTWKHEVINLVETLSINHNWITCTNLQQTWMCIQQELVAVEKEMDAWSQLVPRNDFTIDESMLRGCAGGLDVTSFFFMVLTEQMQRLHKIGDSNGSDPLAYWEIFFDIFVLNDMLTTLLLETIDEFESLEALDQENEATVGSNQDCSNATELSSFEITLHLRQRLSAVLASPALADQALSIASRTVALVDSLKEQYL